MEDSVCSKFPQFYQKSLWNFLTSFPKRGKWQKPLKVIESKFVLLIEMISQFQQLDMNNNDGDAVNSPLFVN